MPQEIPAGLVRRLAGNRPLRNHGDVPHIDALPDEGGAKLQEQPA